MYEAVHAHPDGDATVARLAETAAEYGYDGVVVRNHGDALPDYDPETVTEAYGVDVVDGVEVRADDPSRASGYIGTHRDDRTIVAVHGGTGAINRFAVEQPAVDVLAHPMAGDGDVNHVLAKEAAENRVRLELSLRRVLGADGGERVRALRDLRKLWDLVTEFGAPYVVSADPAGHLHLRAPRELTAVAGTVGFDAGDIEAGLAEWGRLADRNRVRASDRVVEPGVYRGADMPDSER